MKVLLVNGRPTKCVCMCVRGRETKRVCEGVCMCVVSRSVASFVSLGEQRKIGARLCILAVSWVRWVAGKY